MHIASGKGKGRKRNMNFELNLVPFIDVLSTCICFLLVTAVFINLGSFHVNQAVGSQKLETQKKTEGTVTVSFGGDGKVRFEVKGVPGVRGDQSVITIPGDNGKINFAKTERWIEGFAARYTEVKTVLLMPNPTSKYDDLIQMMAQFKKTSMDQIGVAPL